MTDDRPHPPARAHHAKGRSQSICATVSCSMEQLPPTGDGTPQQQRRRRPAARSQSARMTNRRSVKRREAHGVQQHDKSQSNSEPKLTEDSTPDVSPNIKRKGSQRRGTSVYQSRKSAAFLDVPETKKQYHSNTEEDDEDSYRMRSFSFTSKGLFQKQTGIVNRGDSFRRRRSRSNSIAPPQQGSTPSPILDNHNTEVANYTVALLGAQGVGKSALISQFMTSECINAYERQKDILLKTQTVSIMLNGEESELTFQNLTTSKDIDKLNPPDAFVIIFSVVDKASFIKAEAELSRLQDSDLLRGRTTILVANKIDLARSRSVSTQDGKCLACTYRAKFVEISVGINVNVDELLVGILTQIRLKIESYEEGGHSQGWYKSRGMVKASMKARQMFTWIFGKEDSKFKNCENLHIL